MNTKKSVILAIAVIMVGLSIAGGTYAWLNSSVNVINGNYNTMTHCFLIDYTINNADNTQDITGTMFPSIGASGGLNGRVGLKLSTGCTLSGTGTLKLTVDSTTDEELTSPASSYCESRKTLEPLTEYLTESACTTAGGRWRNYGDDYCEDDDTLERMTDYTTSNACTTAGGTWKTGGTDSPLKYAVYNNSTGTGTPLAVGYITDDDIGDEVVLASNLPITTTQAYYYIFIWLDGYLTDNDYTSLHFLGHISAEAIQSHS